MEAVTGPGAAEPGVALALDILEPSLGGKGGCVILGVFADIFAESKRGIGFEGRIEADEQRLAFVDALKLVHPVSHGNVVDRRSPTGPAEKIPRPPYPSSPRHEPDVAMQVNRVGGIGDRTQNGALPLVGIGEHLERLIAVSCNHDMVVGLAGAMAVGHDNATRFSFDGGNRAAEANTVPKRIGQFLDVVSAAALDGSPD